jgi:hypothetical protein
MQKEKQESESEMELEKQFSGSAPLVPSHILKLSWENTNLDWQYRIQGKSVKKDGTATVRSAVFRNERRGARENGARGCCSKVEKNFSVVGPARLK